MPHTKPRSQVSIHSPSVFPRHRETFLACRKSVLIGEICGCLRPSTHHSDACNRLLLPQGYGLGVEFFDFVFGGRGGSGRVGDFYFHQGFSEGFVAGVLGLFYGLEFICS
ncbi:MAG: hypothetical protein RL630_737 [Verrucomicrobiota bacterium]|jgi:hypothetical protein